MFTDIFGYSKMMGDNEARTIRLVEEHRALVRELLPRYDGREHQTIGDAFVVLFDSALNAVTCAVAIQKSMAERNAKLDADEHIWLRIGIHIDDIVMRDGQIYGDGVNLAARVEGVAERGGICVTEQVVRHVGGKVDFAFVSIGERPLKNIEQPPALFAVRVEGAPRPRRQAPSRLPLVVAAALVVAVVAIAAYLRSTRPLAASRHPAAEEAYARGLHHQEALDIDGMNEALLAAVAVDDGLAGAHLRLAAWAFENAPQVAREHFTRAMRHKDRLDDHDRRLAAVLEHYVATAVDADAFVVAADAALADGASAELRFWGAYAHYTAADWKGARAIAEAGDVDAFVPLAWLAGMSALFDADGEAKAVAMLKRCAAASPASTRCLLTLALYQQRTGQCAEMEATAREHLARAPRDQQGDDLLAYALAAQDAPMASVVEILKRSEQKSGPLHDMLEAMDKTRVAAWIGDFAGAEVSAREWLAALGAPPDIAMQVMPNSFLVTTLLETGRPAEVAAAAQTFLDKATAYQPEAFGDDWSIYFINAAAKAGAVDAAKLAASREQWLKAQRRRRPQAAGLIHYWRDAYGEWVRDADDARLALEALAALREQGLVVPAHGMLDPGLALALGQTMLLAGQAPEARPMLEFAASSCVGMLEPYRSTRAQLMVGLAREADGDVAGARGAYEVVVKRWPETSVTAAQARARLNALVSP